MSTSDYDRLYNNIYTKTEVDELIENSVSNQGVITKEQSASIANGSFTGLPIGFYWTVKDINFRIMAHDQFYGYNGINKHHVVVMQDNVYDIYRYNSSNSNDGGYYSSELRSYIENTYNPYITNIFGDNHILSHTHDLTSGTYNNGTLTPTANTKAWLINYCAVYGNQYSETSYSWQTADNTQFPGFKYNNNIISVKYYGQNSSWWLGTSYANNPYAFFRAAVGSGQSYDQAISSNCVRPAFLVY